MKLKTPRHQLKSAGEQCQFEKNTRLEFKMKPHLGLCTNIHALTKLGEGGGFVLVPPLPKPALDLSNVPVQLL